MIKCSETFWSLWGDLYMHIWSIRCFNVCPGRFFDFKQTRAKIHHAARLHRCHLSTRTWSVWSHDCSAWRFTTHTCVSCISDGCIHPHHTRSCHNHESINCSHEDILSLSSWSHQHFRVQTAQHSAAASLDGSSGGMNLCVASWADVKRVHHIWFYVWCDLLIFQSFVFHMKA